MTKCTMTKCLMTQRLMTKCLMTQCLMTQRLMTQRLMTQCLISQCLIAQCLMTKCLKLPPIHILSFLTCLTQLSRILFKWNNSIFLCTFCPFSVLGSYPDWISFERSAPPLLSSFFPSSSALKKNPSLERNIQMNKTHFNSSNFLENRLSFQRRQLNLSVQVRIETSFHQKKIGKTPEIFFLQKGHFPQFLWKRRPKVHFLWLNENRT